ncbi:MAG: hypothetical protein LBQ03_01325 [Puniceicoccales bacterium]|jgi:hypothetical protein|nr:hypothetical protein [Puniceicoccales bacterium]
MQIVMANIYKLINIVSLVSVTSSGIYGSEPWKSDDKEGYGARSDTLPSQTIPHYWNKFSREFQRKFQIGSFSINSNEWRIYPVYFPGKGNPLEDMKKLISCFHGNFQGSSILEMLEWVFRQYGKVAAPFSKELLERLAIICRKNLIVLEVGSGIRVKPDFFEKLTVTKFYNKHVETTQLQSDWLEDENVINELVKNEDLVNLFIQGDKTMTFIYHKGLGKVFYCTLYRVDNNPFGEQEDEGVLSARVKKMNEARTNRLDARITRKLGNVLIEASKGVPLEPNITVGHAMYMPYSNLAEWIIADRDRRLFEEIELFDVERKSKGLKALQELMDADDCKGIKTYFIEFAQFFGRETTNPLGDFEFFKSRARGNEVIVFEEIRKAKGQKGLQELMAVNDREGIMAYFIELAQFFGRKTQDPFGDFEYVKKILSFPKPIKINFGEDPFKNLYYTVSIPESQSEQGQEFGPGIGTSPIDLPDISESE